MEVIVSQSTLADPAAAADEIARALRGPVAFAAVHVAAGHDGSAVRDALADLPAGALHAGSSCLGVMTGAGMASAEGRAMGCFALRDAEGDYGTAAAPFDGDPRAAAAAATARALEAAGRPGEAPDLVWLTASPGCEEAVLAGIADVAGAETPVMGGSAADNAVAGGWYVIGEGRLMSEGLVVSVLFPSRPISFAYQSGYAPTGRSGVATRVEGRRLVEIDGRPAGAVYADWTGHADWHAPRDEPLPILGESTFAPLGRAVADVQGVPFHLLAHPATLEPDGAIGLFADVAEGERIELMAGSTESLTQRAGRVARQAVESCEGPGRVAGALVIYCGGCMLAVREHMGTVVEGIDTALAGAPFLGIFTFGEQGAVHGGPVCHGNLMISCVVFGE